MCLYISCVWHDETTGYLSNYSVLSCFFGQRACLRMSIRKAACTAKHTADKSVFQHAILVSKDARGHSDTRVNVAVGTCVCYLLDCLPFPTQKVVIQKHLQNPAKNDVGQLVFWKRKQT